MSGKQYYLIAQLPDITNAERTLPVTESYYRDVCARFLSAKQLEVLAMLSLVPPRTAVPTGSQFLDAWYEHERNLRFALAQIRAQKMKRDAEQVPSSCTQDIVAAARTAVGMDSPLSAEQFLHEYRMSVLNSMRPLDMFSIDAVYEYGIRLLLVQRMKKFNKETGTVSYHRIYDSILENSND
ncbi:MAG: DUF2764 family protein [Treponema sp.]|nr:DUF2764 family protein [Treponema sp.]